jgi:hypothetical protein
MAIETTSVVFGVYPMMSKPYVEPPTSWKRKRPVPIFKFIGVPVAKAKMRLPAVTASSWNCAAMINFCMLLWPAQPVGVVVVGGGGRGGQAGGRRAWRRRQRRVA